MPWSMAPLIEVPPPNSMRGARSMRAAKASASAALPMRVHDTAGAWRRGPVHWNMVTAMDCVGPEAMALCRRGLRKASA